MLYALRRAVVKIVKRNLANEWFSLVTLGECIEIASLAALGSKPTLESMFGYFKSDGLVQKRLFWQATNSIFLSKRWQLL